MKTVTAHIKAAAECIPTKLRAKCGVLCESIVVREKWDNVKKKGSILKNIQQTSILRNIQKKKKKKKIKIFKAKSIKSEIW